MHWNANQIKNRIIKITKRLLQLRFERERIQYKRCRKFNNTKRLTVRCTNAVLKC